MSKPKIRFKGYEEDWEQRKLSDITLKIGSGKTPSGGKNAYVDDGIPLIRSQNINNDRVDLEDIVFIDEETDNSMENSRVFTDDVLLNITGASIGRSAVYRGKDKANVNQHVCIIRPTKDFDSDFIQLNLASNFGQKQIDASQAGGGREGLNFQEIGKMSFMFPSNQEQMKIGVYFNHIDYLITLHQRKCEETKKLKKYMLQKMFPQNGKRVPEIRFVGFTEDWEQRKLKETIEYIVDNRGKNPDYYCSEGIPVIDNFMIRNSLYPDLNTATRFIDENLYQNFIRKYNEEDDILLTLVGNGIGNITLFPKDKAVIIQNTLGFRAKEDKKFLFFLLMANNEALVKLDRGMAQPSIRQDEILDLDIYVPSNSEQIQIGEYFTYLDNLITLHQRKYEELQKIKKFMLQNMFI